ncbi:MAG: hypothetical protein K2J54_04850 [Clostridia bacterium]|nr:hypothetical protein [Clostridia bacterium]MDE7256353.1 hypothetical protein [Clostridia bacterium]
MFGYINPDGPYLFIKDETLYKAMYCGMCKSIGKGCGNFAKTALTYDIAFMSALLHNISGNDVKIEKRRCALHLIKRRPMAVPDDISLLLGCVNTVLAYYKLLDDKADGDKKGAFAFMYKRGFKKALKRHPEVEKIIKRGIEEQRSLEKAGCAVIDGACEPTAQMMKEISRYCLKESATEHTDALCYDIGKWVYLADALDDYDKDVKKGRYNVLFNAFGEREKAQAVQKNGEEINFLFNSLFADMRMRLANITFHFNHDLTDNIILRGIPLKTRRLVYGKCGEGKKKEYEQTQS